MTSWRSTWGNTRARGRTPVPAAPLDFCTPTTWRTICHYTAAIGLSSARCATRPLPARTICSVTERDTAAWSCAPVAHAAATARTPPPHRPPIRSAFIPTTWARWRPLDTCTLRRGLVCRFSCLGPGCPSLRCCGGRRVGRWWIKAWGTRLHTRQLHIKNGRKMKMRKKKRKRRFLRWRESENAGVCVMTETASETVVLSSLFCVLFCSLCECRSVSMCCSRYAKMSDWSNMIQMYRKHLEEEWWWWMYKSRAQGKEWTYIYFHSKWKEFLSSLDEIYVYEYDRCLHDSDVCSLFLWNWTRPQFKRAFVEHECTLNEKVSCFILGALMNGNVFLSIV